MTTTTGSNTVTGLRREDVQDLLYREARFLDEGRYDEWLELMAPEIRYWIPSWRSETDAVEDVTTEISLLYYERPMLVDYVARMRSGDAHIAEPAARTDRLVTNVLIEEGDDGRVRAKWLLHHYRRGQQHLFVGDADYRLRWQEARLLIADKRVLVSNSSLERGYLPLV